MKIEISKQFPKPTRKIIAAGLRASDKFAPLMVERVGVAALKKKDRKAMAASCGMRGKSLLIILDAKAELPDMLDSLFHEAYHGYQMGNGSLRAGYGCFYWKGWTIPLWVYESLHFSNFSLIPFEREAIAYARKMVAQLEFDK